MNLLWNTLEFCGRSKAMVIELVLKTRFGLKNYAIVFRKFVDLAVCFGIFTPLL